MHQLRMLKKQQRLTTKLLLHWLPMQLNRWQM
jgi:hypothetical protein